MKRIVTALLLLLMTLPTYSGMTDVPAGGRIDNLSNVQLTNNFASMPLAFTANKGQWDEMVLYRANAGGATMWFASEGAYYQFTRVIPTGQANTRQKDRPSDLQELSVGQTSPSAPNVTLSGVKGVSQPDSIETIIIKANFIGSNPNPIMLGVDMMEYKCNYFIGNDPNKWYTDVRNYSAVMYEEIYDGIDLKYYGNGKQMEYDFIVSPGADYSQIKIRYEGAESISINDIGELVIETKWGEVVEQRPIVYQIDNNSRIAVAGKYSIKGTSAFSFELSDFDPALPLVIDPVLSYSTYLGGNSDDFGRSIAVDASGAAYITGYTVSPDFPTLNPYQGTYQGGSYDVFVSKLSSSGNSLVYSTYLGGNGTDDGYGIAVDAFGAVYVSGVTFSTDFPTLNPYQGTLRGWSDAFVTKLSPSGNSLVYSTYFGGIGFEESYNIVIDTSGVAYVTGRTSSLNLPTLNPYKGTLQGPWDVFVTQFSPSGNSLIYSTYLGGSGFEEGYDIAVDASGAAYVTGYTSSPDFPTVNAYTGTYQGGGDAFVTKLSSSGNSLVYSTFLGGGIEDYGWGIAVDVSGAAYVTGRTNSPDFPTLNPYQGTFQGTIEAFVTKFNSSGSSLVYSTYLGGSNDDYGWGIAVDASGAAYITGGTNSPDFPTLNPFQGTFQGGSDAFVTALGSTGNSLVYSTFLGGSTGENGFGIAVDASRAAYVTGRTNSPDFPKLTPFQTALRGGVDAFVTKFKGGCCIGMTGNVDNDPGEIVDIGDLTELIAYLFIPPNTPPLCMEEANVDGDVGGVIDIGDLTALIGYLFIPPNVQPAACQ